MRDSYANRLMMFHSALDTLRAPEHRAVWFEQSPAVFTAKLHRATDAVAELTAFCREQEREIPGAGEQRRREANELEETVYVAAGSLAIWFRDRGDEPRVVEVGLTRSQWQNLREHEFLEKCRLVHQVAQSVVAGPESAEAVGYGITADAVHSLARAIDEYAAVVTASQQSMADRRARTQQLRERFNAVEAQFEVLDRLILHFGATAAGRDLVAEYQAARIIRDLGGRSGRFATTESPVLAASSLT